VAARRNENIGSAAEQRTRIDTAPAHLLVLVQGLQCEYGTAELRIGLDRFVRFTPSDLRVSRCRRRFAQIFFDVRENSSRAMLRSDFATRKRGASAARR
jgi:hypothetical protein